MNRPERIVIDDARARPVRPRGARGPADGRWYWRVDVGRKTVWTGWGTRDEVRRRVSALIATDALEKPQQDRPVRIVTVRDLMEHWLPQFRKRGKAERTVVSYKGAAKRIVRSSLGIMHVRRLTPVTAPAALQGWVDEARLQYADMTVALDHQVLRTAWRWGMTIGVAEFMLPEAPIGVVRPKRSKYTPSRSEVRTMIAELERSAPSWAARLMKVQVATGARIGELADLRWENVHTARSQITVDGKTGARTVELPPHLTDMLLEARVPRDFIFGVRPSSARGVWKYLRRACDAVEVPRWTTHALRRLAVDRLARAGVDPATAAKILGHSVTVMYRMYRQVTEEDERRAMAAARLWDLGSEDNVIELSGRGESR